MLVLVRCVYDAAQQHFRRKRRDKTARTVAGTEVGCYATVVTLHPTVVTLHQTVAR